MQCQWLSSATLIHKPSKRSLLAIQMTALTGILLSIHAALTALPGVLCLGRREIYGYLCMHVFWG